MEAQINTNYLQQKIKGYLETLARETDLARKSEEMQRYLEFEAKFHQYSATNIFLILLNKPEATHIAGYQTWKTMGRFVKKGEKGIPIFAPLLARKDSEEKDSPQELYGFRIVYVFDISQTDGEPLPSVPDWKSPEKNAELNERLIAFAKGRGVEVLIKKQSGEIQGVSMGGLIEIDPSAGTKTLIHEIAHELMHRDEDCPLDHAFREREAEATAFVVAKYFGLSKLKSYNYLALYELRKRKFCIV
jgi:N-terminal domain of anti-restriction factor ArdC